MDIKFAFPKNKCFTRGEKFINSVIKTARGVVNYKNAQ